MSITIDARNEVIPTTTMTNSTINPHNNLKQTCVNNINVNEADINQLQQQIPAVLNSIFSPDLIDIPAYISFIIRLCEIMYYNEDMQLKQLYENKKKHIDIANQKEVNKIDTQIKSRKEKIHKIFKKLESEYAASYYNDTIGFKKFLETKLQVEIDSDIYRFINTNVSELITNHKQQTNSILTFANLIHKLSIDFNYTDMNIWLFCVLLEAELKNSDITLSKNEVCHRGIIHHGSTINKSLHRSLVNLPTLINKFLMKEKDCAKRDKFFNNNLHILDAINFFFNNILSKDRIITTNPGITSIKDTACQVMTEYEQAVIKNILYPMPGDKFETDNERREIKIPPHIKTVT